MNLRRHLMLITAIPIVRDPLWLHSHCGSTLHCPLSEDMLPTYHEKIKIFRSPAQAPEAIASWMTQLQALVRAGDPERVRSHVLELVPEYLGAKPVTRIARIGDRELEGVCV